MMPRAKNNVKDKIKRGEKVLLSWAQAASNITTEILASSGFDAILIDMEHGPGDYNTLLSQVQAMNGYPTVPFVRAPWNDAVTIKKILDVGVYGLLIPYVETAEEAKQAVSSAKYPPRGIRSIAGSTRAAHYGNNSKEYFSIADDEILTFIAIESLKGIDNLDEILKIKDLDGIFVGPADLATSMGHLGDYSVGEVQERIDYIEKKAISANKILMALAFDWETAQQKFNKGANLVICMSDTVTLGAVARQQVERFQKQYGGKKS